MQTISLTFSVAGTQTAVAAAPSGARYILMGLACDDAEVSACVYPSSGALVTTDADNPLTGIKVYPSGDTGYAEPIYVTATAPCSVLLTYDTQVKTGYINDFSTEKCDYRDKLTSYQKWTPTVLSGSYYASHTPRYGG